MINKAKCKLCGSIIQSFHAQDLVLCNCGEISVDGGDALRCASKNWSNFIRVDDEGNEIIPKIIDKANENINTLQGAPITKPTKKELIQTLDEMRKNIENLPPQAMTSAINHYDWASLLILLSALFRSDCSEDS